MAADDIRQKLQVLENQVAALEAIVQETASGPAFEYTSALVDFFSPGISSPMFQPYLTYALRSLQRGENLVRKFAVAQSGARRYLDIGCAYGGAVIAMAREGIPTSVGIDVDERLIDLAELHARRYQLEQTTTFAVADITDAESCSNLGTFDFITCIDVLEHALDPEAAIKNIAMVTESPGVVVVDVPNPQSAQVIRKDPHHHLFGSALLERDDAISVFSEVFPGNKRYTVGYFHNLEWYVDKFEDSGFTVTLTDDLSDAESRWPDVREATESLPVELARRADSESWPEWRLSLVSTPLEQHMKKFYEDTGVDTDVTTLYRRYGLPVYHLRCEI